MGSGGHLGSSPKATGAARLHRRGSGGHTLSIGRGGNRCEAFRSVVIAFAEHDRCCTSTTPRQRPRCRYRAAAPRHRDREPFLFGAPSQPGLCLQTGGVCRVAHHVRPPALAARGRRAYQPRRRSPTPLVVGAILQEATQLVALSRHGHDCLPVAHCRLATAQTRPAVRHRAVEQPTYRRRSALSASLLEHADLRDFDE
jgi:hypothetical protein